MNFSHPPASRNAQYEIITTATEDPVPNLVEMIITIVVVVVLIVVGKLVLRMRFITAATAALAVGLIISGISLGITRDCNFDSQIVATRRNFFEVMSVLFTIFVFIHIIASSYREISRFS